MAKTVELKYDGRSYEMSPAQLRTTNIGLIFGLDPKTIWLKDIGGRCYFPDGEELKYGDMEDHTYTLLVEGWPLSSSEKLPLTFMASSGKDQAATSSTPCRAKGLGNKMYNNCTIKVVRAKKEVNAGGKIEFLPYEATYLELKPSTANASYIQSQVQKIWGAEYSIVSNDGLEIADTSATRGIKFWKVGSRKIFAISSKSHLPKKRRYSDEETTINDKLDTIDYKLSKILEVTPHLKVPLALSAQIYDTFRCSICKISPIIPPAIFARCCKRILGCMECTDKWYKGEEGMSWDCPLCRSVRGYSDTSRILGLDDFLMTIKDLHTPEARDPTSEDLD